MRDSKVCRRAGFLAVTATWDVGDKIDMEPNNHPFEKENHLPNLHYCVPCYVPGCNFKSNDFVGAKNYTILTKCLLIYLPRHIPRCLPYKSLNGLRSIPWNFHHTKVFTFRRGRSQGRTVDGSEIVHQLGLVVSPIIYDGLYTSPEVVWDFWTINRSTRPSTLPSSNPDLILRALHAQILQGPTVSHAADEAQQDKVALRTLPRISIDLNWIGLIGWFDWLVGLVHWFDCLIGWLIARLQGKPDVDGIWFDPVF